MSKYLPESSVLDISVFSRMLKNTTNSYKYLFFLAILARLSHITEQVKHLNNNNSVEIKLIDIATEMLLIAWFPHTYFKLSFGVQDQLVSILNKFLFSQTDLEETSISKSSVNRLRINLYNWLSQNIGSLRLIVKYVPYRLLAPFFEKELRGLPDATKNDRIKKMSEDYFDERKPLYKIHDESILIHKYWLNYINNNFAIVEGWAKWEWCDYLQSRNPSVPSIPRKILPVFNRMSMSKETTYWSKILELKPISCIYSHESLNDDFSLDHFLPWTFVTHNQLWNLIPVNSSANSSKSNNLPDLDSYLTKFIETHSTAIHLSRKIFSDKKWQRYMEPYISDLHLTSYVDVLDEVKLEVAYKNTILPLYEIAQSNGFCANWQYIDLNTKNIVHSRVNAQTVFEQHLVDQIPENKKYVSSLPFYPLEIAAGGFVDSEIDEDSKQWINTKQINLFRSLNKDMFISQIHGHSMEPLIPDGSYCLFKYGVADLQNGRIVLVKKEGYEDPETKASFTIKKYFSRKTTASEFDWGHEKIELRPENPEYPVLSIGPDDADNFHVIAEFLQVIE